MAASAGRNGEIPPAVRSALTKSMSLAIPGKWSRANVVFPAPLGPAMMMQRGFRRTLAMAQVYQFRDESEPTDFSRRRQTPINVGEGPVLAPLRPLINVS
jgi:hypothetical protein